METLLPLMLVLGIEMAMLIWGATASDPYRLRGFVAVRNMMMIGLFAPLLMTIGGITSNIGNVWYAAVICTQAIVLERFGRRAAYDIIVAVYGTMAALFATCAVLPLFPVVAGNELWVRAAHKLVEHDIAVIFASFAGFGVAQIVLIGLYGRLRPTAGPQATMIISCVAAQVIDSSVFFPVAFWGMPAAQMASIMMGGLIFKIAMVIVLWPVFAASIRLPHGRAPRVVGQAP